MPSTARRRTGPQPRTGHAWRKAKAYVFATYDTCWLCGERVDKTLPWPHRRSKSVDHVTPLAMGGRLTDPANLRLAHLSCNASRGARTPDTQRSDPLPASRRW